MLYVTSPTSQLILQPFRRFTYVTDHSQTLPLLHLRNSSFSNASFASPTSQALHLILLASRPCLLDVHSEKLVTQTNGNVTANISLLLGFTTLFNILGYRRRFRHRA